VPVPPMSPSLFYGTKGQKARKGGGFSHNFQKSPLHVRLADSGEILRRRRFVSNVTFHRVNPLDYESIQNSYSVEKFHIKVLFFICFRNTL
jgi:hypothetical protein